MIDRFQRLLKHIRPDFRRRTDELLNPYFTFANYNKIWAIGIFGSRADSPGSP